MREIAWAQGLTQKEVIDAALRFANHPTPLSWCRLFGGELLYAAPGAESAPAPEIHDAAAWLQAALSDIAHERQTAEQIKAWRDTASRVVPMPTRVVDGRHVRETLLWQAPTEELPSVVAGDWLFITQDVSALLATVLLWLVNPELPFTGMHECGRGEHCDRKRFYFRARRYCCPEHTIKANQATNPERSKDRRERNKAITTLKPRFPQSARKLVWAVKAPGLSADELVQRAIEHHNDKHK